MKLIRFQRTALLLIATAIFLSIQGAAERDPSELVPPVMKLTRAVVGELVYGENGAKLTDEQLLEAAMTSDPALKKELTDAHIRLRHTAKTVIVLVCSADERRALIEDASWTSRVDNKWFEDKETHACEFTIAFDGDSDKKQTTSGAEPTPSS